VFIQTQWVDQWKRIYFAFCSAMFWNVPGKHSTDLSFCLDIPIQNCMSMEKINSCWNKYTISNSAFISWRSTSYSWTPRQFCSALWRRRRCFYKQRRTAATSFKRCRLLAKHRLLQMWDLRRPVQCPPQGFRTPNI